MGRVVDPLSVAELEARYQACEDVTSSRHFQTIFLLAKGHSTQPGQIPGRFWWACHARAGVTRVASAGIFGPGIPRRSPMKW